MILKKTSSKILLIFDFYLLCAKFTEKYNQKVYNPVSILN